MRTAVIILLALALVFSGFIAWALFGPLGKNPPPRKHGKSPQAEGAR